MAVIALLLLLVSCSSERSTAHPTTTYRTIPLTPLPEESPREAVTTEQVVEPAATVTVPDRSSNPFLGEWYVHGSELHITSDTEGRQIDYSGQESWTTELKLMLSADGSRLDVEVVSSTYLGPDGTIEADPYPESSFVPGDRYVLQLKAPHMLEVVDIDTQNTVIGNPVWCEAGISADLSPACGA